jgi:60S ribosomal subunit assembly/export protein LOC1
MSSYEEFIEIWLTFPQESMTTILALVQAEKEGQIESKMIKARQLEEIREARRAEADSKEEERKAQLEETKDSIRKKRKRPRGGKDSDTNGFKAFMAEEQAKASRPDKTKKKKVSFAPE